MHVSELVAARRNRDWALFVDRDGVINARADADYIRDLQGFNYLPGALKSLVDISKFVPHVVIVTNQQGVGKGLMTIRALCEIHEALRLDVENLGGALDSIVVCTHLAAQQCPCRKPEPGMALEWLKSRPTVDGALSIMVGDSPSDMIMLQRLRHHTGGGASVGIGRQAGSEADLHFPDLQTFVRAYIQDEQ